MWVWVKGTFLSKIRHISHSWEPDSLKHFSGVMWGPMRRGAHKQYWFLDHCSWDLFLACRLTEVCRMCFHAPLAKWWPTSSWDILYNGVIRQISRPGDTWWISSFWWLKTSCLKWLAVLYVGRWLAMDEGVLLELVWFDLIWCCLVSLFGFYLPWLELIDPIRCVLANQRGRSIWLDIVLSLNLWHGLTRSDLK